MKTSLFKPSRPISVLSVLDKLKTACDNNSIHKDAATWLFPHFVTEPAKAALPHRMTADKRNHQQGDKLTTYCQVINYLLETFATDNIIAEAESDITSFEKPVGTTGTRHFEILFEKALRCGVVYNEPRLKEIFIESLRSSICYSTRKYWGAHKGAKLHSLARYATNHVKLQENTHGTSSSMVGNNRRWPKSSKLSRRRKRNTPVLAIREDVGSFSSSFEAKK